MNFNYFRKLTSFTLIAAFAVSSLYIPQAQAGEMIVPLLPKPGTMVNLSSAFVPAHLKGITIHPDDALKFDFLIHKGDGQLDDAQKRQEYKKLVKYFLASLTIPDEDQWVNLSPYEKNRIIKDNFGKTEMGRDLLSQDYLLKQITSSLMYPESGLGKAFWDKVYERAYKEYGNTNIPVNTFNKVWIIPDEAIVYESGNTAYVLKSHLKVMLEEDYLSLDKNSVSLSFPNALVGNPGMGQKAGPPIKLVPECINRGTFGGDKGVHTLGSQIVREVILPEIEKEVNEGKNFAMLRQIYSGMILATWYKKALKESLLGKIYADKAKVKGVDQDPKANEAIYQKYLAAFKKGVYNYIKEDFDQYTNQTIPRKYFAGGFGRELKNKIRNKNTILPDEAMLGYQEEKVSEGNIDRVTAALKEEKNDGAMLVAENDEGRPRRGSYNPELVTVVPTIHTLAENFEHIQDYLDWRFSEAKRAGRILRFVDEFASTTDNAMTTVTTASIYREDFFTSVQLRNNMWPGKDTDVLVLGTGQGSDAFKAVERGAGSVLATDILEPVIRDNQRKLEKPEYKDYQGKVAFVQADLFNFPPEFQRRKFDHIYSNPPLANEPSTDASIADPQFKLMKRLLKEAHHWLRDGGTLEMLYLETPAFLRLVYEYGWEPVVVKGNQNYPYFILVPQKNKIQRSAELKQLLEDWKTVESVYSSTLKEDYLQRLYSGEEIQEQRTFLRQKYAMLENNEEGSDPFIDIFIRRDERSKNNLEDALLLKAVRAVMATHIEDDAMLSTSDGNALDEKDEAMLYNKTARSRLKNSLVQVIERLNPCQGGQCVDASKEVKSLLEKQSFGQGMIITEKEIFVPHDFTQPLEIGMPTTSHTILDITVNIHGTNIHWVVDTQLQQFKDLARLPVSDKFIHQYVYDADNYFEQIPAFADSIGLQRISLVHPKRSKAADAAMAAKVAFIDRKPEDITILEFLMEEKGILEKSLNYIHRGLIKFRLGSRHEPITTVADLLKRSEEEVRSNMGKLAAARLIFALEQHGWYLIGHEKRPYSVSLDMNIQSFLEMKKSTLGRFYGYIRGKMRNMNIQTVNDLLNKDAEQLLLAMTVLSVSALKKALEEAELYMGETDNDTAMMGVIGKTMDVNQTGGIDLNSANLKFQIKRDGRGVPLPLAQQDMAQLDRIHGFEPEIIEIKAVTFLPILGELQQKMNQRP